MRAAIYTRVSTQDQAEEGFSLDAQLHRLRAYCESQGWEVVDVYTDDGYSAKDMNRPDLQRLLSDIRQRKVDVVLVYRLDRLTRSVLDLHEMLQLFDKYGVGFKSATEVFDTTTAMGRLFITIVAALAQWERETIGERTREGQAQMVREGRYFGHTAPYGYDLEDGKLVINEAEAEVIRKVFRLYISGYGVSRIVKYLNDPENGMPRPRGADKWNMSVILRTLQNPVYAGYVRYGNKTRRLRREEPVIAKSDHEPIISENEFRLAQQIRERRKTAPPRSGTGMFPLVGVLRCGLCGGAMTGRRERAGRSGRTKEYLGYMCNQRRHTRACTMKMWKCDVIEEAVLDEIERIRTSKEPMMDIAKSPDEDNRRQAILAELKRLEQERRRWLEAYRKEAITADELREQRQYIERREEALKEELESISHDESPDAFLELTKDLRKTWEESTTQERRELIRAIAETIWVYEDGSVKIDFRTPF